ncbi:MAG: thiolase family protein, partial [Labilithrix sp.]|nr:thiolase family protein [Labilithrix sp.]
TEEQHEVVLMRSEEYARACADDAAFLRRFMLLPFSIADRRGGKAFELTGDEGVVRSTREGLAKLRPVREGGTVTYGGQTHPADGAAGCVVTTEARARELSTDPSVRVRLAGFGQARVDRGFMPEAPVPAARRALDRAGLAMSDVVAVKSHNPFAVNDVVFARETGFDLRAMNRYGCSLVWGHPQAPTGLRAILELVEELVLRGGGVGLFQGCAAGDTGMAVVVEVTQAKP